MGHEIWGLDAEVWSMLYLGQHDAAFDLARRGSPSDESVEAADRLARLDFLGARALVHLYRGELPAAKHAADLVVEAIATLPRHVYFAVLGMSAAAETSSALWEADGQSALNSGTAARARHLCRRIEQYAARTPISERPGAFWRGWAEALDGQPRKANATWQLCLKAAERLALPYETARANYEIGRRLNETNTDRQARLTRSRDGFRPSRPISR